MKDSNKYGNLVKALDKAMEDILVSLNTYGNIGEEVLKNHCVTLGVGKEQYQFTLNADLLNGMKIFLEDMEEMERELEK